MSKSYNTKTNNLQEPRAGECDVVGALLESPCTHRWVLLSLNQSKEKPSRSSGFSISTQPVLGQMLLLGSWLLHQIDICSINEANGQRANNPQASPLGINCCCIERVHQTKCQYNFQHKPRSLSNPWYHPKSHWSLPNNKPIKVIRQWWINVTSWSNIQIG